MVAGQLQSMVSVYTGHVFLISSSSPSSSLYPDRFDIATVQR